MKEINVIDLLNSPVLLAAEKGELLYEEIKKHSKSKVKVPVNFKGYKFLSSTFLNNAFGQLCIDLNLDEKSFFEKVKVVGLNEDDTDDLNMVISNAQFRKKLIEDKINVQEFYSSFMSY
jgi:cytochrome b involved in lipid metabolism